MAAYLHRVHVNNVHISTIPNKYHMARISLYVFQAQTFGYQKVGAGVIDTPSIVKVPKSNYIILMDCTKPKGRCIQKVRSRAAHEAVADQGTRFQIWDCGNQHQPWLKSDQEFIFWLFVMFYFMLNWFVYLMRAKRNWSGLFISQQQQILLCVFKCNFVCHLFNFFLLHVDFRPMNDVRRWDRWLELALLSLKQQKS